MISKNNIVWYLEKMIELLCVSPMENQFQSYLIYPIIEEVISKKKESNDIELIDCHNFSQSNTKTHNRCKYSVLSKAIPDLLLAKNFFYNNRNDKIYDSMKSIASIEVKTPNNIEMLNKYVKNNGDESKKEYNDELYIQLLPSLIKNKKVILSNVRRWEFFDNHLINDENLNLCIDIKKYIEIIEICGFDSSTDYINYKTKDLEPSVIIKKMKLLKEIISKNTKEEMKTEIEKILGLLSEKVTKSDFDKIVKLADEIYIKEIKEYIKKSHMKTVDIIKLKENVPEKNMVVFYGLDFEQKTKVYNNEYDDEYITGIHDIKYELNALENLKLELEKFLNIENF